MIKSGDVVLITDASGVEHRATAVGGVEPGRDFPVVWVMVERYDGGSGERAAWPAESVREMPEGWKP